MVKHRLPRTEVNLKSREPVVPRGATRNTYVLAFLFLSLFATLLITNGHHTIVYIVNVLLVAHVSHVSLISSRHHG